MSKLAYGCRSVNVEGARAAWGARLIYNEVRDGGSGVVPDRMDSFGFRKEDGTTDKSMSEALDHAVNLWIKTVRQNILGGALRPDDDRTFTVSTEAFTVTGSPQKSYGYLYVTAVLNEEPYTTHEELAK